MYNLNTLMRNVLITPKEVLFHAPTKHTIDERMIEQSIIIAEERFLRDEIGSPMYEAIATAKNRVVTELNKADLQALIGNEILLNIDDVVNSYKFLSSSYQTLWKQYMWKILAECVMIVSFSEGFVQFSSEGVFHTVPPAGLMVTSGLVTPELRSVKWSIDKKIQDRVAPLMSAMQNYLCKNKASYTLYTKECPCDEEIKKPKHTDLILSLYDDVNERECECGPGWSP